MTRAFQKHTVDRNTVVSTSAIAEVAIAAPEVYEEALAKRPQGETVLAFAKRCEAAIQGDEEIKDKIESMKAGVHPPSLSFGGRHGVFGFGWVGPRLEVRSLPSLTSFS
ncbi:hypothetical protein NFI96_007915 [Prochilodus magdalenae]|nr:hypothetical protein NFI96_007915 [Prochilodus magdalenae]